LLILKILIRGDEKIETAGSQSQELAVLKAGPTCLSYCCNFVSREGGPKTAWQ